VLHGVSITVAKGDMVAIIGPNGAGKSTLLNCISGILATTGGSIKLEGGEITGEAAFKISRAGLLQVPEGRQILGELTVLENLQLGVTALHGRKPTHDLRRIYKLFPILEERNQQRAGSLSGGQQQMLAIAQALLRTPRLLMLDEPSLGLAPIIVDQVMEVILKLRDQGVAIVLVEQLVERALEVADIAYVLRSGRILGSGRPADLQGGDLIKHAYLGV
jgi:branched-chain amino acid transport system ATP-binding protein